jgi:hypothetical protein
MKPPTKEFFSRPILIISCKHCHFGFGNHIITYKMSSACFFWFEFTSFLACFVILQNLTYEKPGLFSGDFRQAVRVRVVSLASLTAENFVTKVGCHREMQSGLRKIFLASFKKRKLREYIFICIVIHNIWAFVGVFIDII